MAQIENVVPRLLPDSPVGTFHRVQQSATLEKSDGGSGGCIYSISSSLDLKRSTLPLSSARAGHSRSGSTSRPTEPPPPPPGPQTGAIPKKKSPVKEEVTEEVVEPVVAPGAAALPPPAPVPNSLSEALLFYRCTHALAAQAWGATPALVACPCYRVPKCSRTTLLAVRFRGRQRRRSPPAWWWGGCPPSELVGRRTCTTSWRTEERPWPFPIVRTLTGTNSLESFVKLYCLYTFIILSHVSRKVSFPVSKMIICRLNT